MTTTKIKSYAQAGVDIEGDEGEIFSQAEKIGIDKKKLVTREVALDEIFKKTIRGTLIQPTFIYDYPKNMFPLTKKKNEYTLKQWIHLCQVKPKRKNSTRYLARFVTKLPLKTSFR